jgi:uncharacterized membrane protein
MKKNTFLALATLVFVLMVSSCSQNTYDDIEEETNPIPETVTYQDVKSLIDNTCLACHSNPPQNGAPMSLTIFDNVKEAVLNRDLLNKINKNEGEDGLMPLGGPRLPQSSIDLLFKWNEDGLLEN